MWVALCCVQTELSLVLWHITTFLINVTTAGLHSRPVALLLSSRSYPLKHTVVIWERAVEMTARARHVVLLGTLATMCFIGQRCQPA